MYYSMLLEACDESKKGVQKTRGFALVSGEKSPAQTSPVHRPGAIS